jgi:hypothetical protein
MKKSAMQELKDNSLFTEGEEYIQIVLKKTEWIELLKKEKEQIIEAWDKRGSTIVPRYFLEKNINGEEYYNQTYNN